MHLIDVSKTSELYETNDKVVYVLVNTCIFNVVILFI